MNNKLLGLISASALLAGNVAHAAVVTHGRLTSDSATNYITDTVSGRQYTRLDAFDLTVAQVQTAIGVGGAFAGWSIMTSVEADDFVSAIFSASSTPCSGQVAYGTACGTVSGWADGNFGNSYNSSIDYIAFLNTNSDRAIGLLEVSGGNGLVREYENWSTVGSLDYWSVSGNGGIPINLMLYRDNDRDNAVPVPGTLLLASLGLALMGIRRRL